MSLSVRSATATAAMRRNLDSLIAERRRHPGDDVVSLMTHVDGNDVLTDDEIFWTPPCSSAPAARRRRTCCRACC
jgi:cytochrome P450